MSGSYRLVYHKELNMFNCFCGYMGLFHHCSRKIRGHIHIISCPTDCSLCEKEADRKEYNSFRWKTDRDGYVCCGTRYNKLGSDPICTSCFCASCYSSVDEKCACFEN